MSRRLIYLVVLCILLMGAPLRSLYATDDVSFNSYRLNDFGSVMIKIGQKIGFDVAGWVIPIFNDEEQIPQPDHEPVAKWAEAYNKYANPQNYTDDGKHIPWLAETIFYTTWYGASLFADAEHSNHPDPPDCYISLTPEKSSHVEFGELEFEMARRSDAWWGINPVNPNESGIVDFNYPVKTIHGMNSAEDCKKQDPGIAVSPIENNLKALASYGEEAMIEGHEVESIWHWVTEIVNGITKQIKVFDTEQKDNHVILTSKRGEPYYNCQCHYNGCPEPEAGECAGNSAVSGGVVSAFLREEDNPPVMSSSQYEHQITIGDFPVGKAKSSYDIEHRKIIGMKRLGCASVPDTSNTSLGNIQKTTYIYKDKLNIMSECEPNIEQCKVDTWEEVLSKLPGAINKTCEKYKDKLPISTSQCAAMMNTIFDIEIRNDPEWSGTNYRCERRSDSSAAGPFQIIDESYSIVACSEEQMEDDLSGCKSAETQLSRCMTEDATEMAMRIILNFSNCNSAGKLATIDDLYRRVCEYGTGVCVPLSHLGNKTYCEYVFDAAGIPKPANTCSGASPATTPP